jgi:hypothetical protein
LEDSKSIVKEYSGPNSEKTSWEFKTSFLKGIQNRFKKIMKVGYWNGSQTLQTIRGPILENHGMTLFLKISFYLKKSVMSSFSKIHFYDNILIGISF